MKRDLRFEFTYPHPVESVWSALTDSRALAVWLMPNNFEPRLGHEFQFRAKPQPGWDGVARCKVTEIDPPRRLSYTWTGGPIDTVAVFTLEPVGTGTRLVLEHTGFRGLKAVMVSFLMGMGWRKKILRTSLPAFLDRGPHGGSKPAQSAR